MAAAMETPPEENLQAVSFATHATRGLIRDRAMRRKTIAILLAARRFHGNRRLHVLERRA